MSERLRQMRTLLTAAPNRYAGTVADVRKAVADERNACASKAREFAEHYPQYSDGRNTLIMLAEWIENRPNKIEQ